MPTTGVDYVVCCETVLDAAEVDATSDEVPPEVHGQVITNATRIRARKQTTELSSQCLGQA